MAFQPTWSPEDRDRIVAEVCARHSQGETIASILRTEGMPSRVTIYDWLGRPEHAERFARARAAAMDAIADEAMTIADEAINDTFLDDTGRKRVDQEVVQRSKLRVETRLKLLAKWAPGAYGDRVHTDITSSDGSLKATDETTQAARMAAILASATARRGEAEGSDLA
jgi:transposase-like protein